MTRIAVADDDNELRTLIAELLREHGLDVVEAGDGATLLALLHRGGISLVVTDLWMPRLTGSDVLQLRRGSGDSTPFIVITAASRPLAEPLRATEGVTVLYKPFTEQAVVEAVLATLDPSKAAAGTPPEGVTTVVAATSVVADAIAIDRARPGSDGDSEPQ